MKITHGALVRINRLGHIWLVVGYRAGATGLVVELVRRERLAGGDQLARFTVGTGLKPFVLEELAPVTTIRQVWPVNMLQLVAAA